MSDLTSKEISNLANAVGNPHGLSYDEEQRIKRALTDYAALLERPQEAREPLTPLQKERNYKTHKTRMSDASSFDEICTECGATDFPGSDLLDLPCPKAVPPHEPEGVDLCPSGRRWCKGPNGNGRRCHACEADRTTQTKADRP